MKKIEEIELCRILVLRVHLSVCVPGLSRSLAGDQRIYKTRSLLCVHFTCL